MGYNNDKIIFYFDGCPFEFSLTSAELDHKYYNSLNQELCGYVVNIDFNSVNHWNYQKLEEFSEDYKLHNLALQLKGKTIEGEAKVAKRLGTCEYSLDVEFQTSNKPLAF